MVAGDSPDNRVSVTRLQLHHAGGIAVLLMYDPGSAYKIREESLSGLEYCALFSELQTFAVQNAGLFIASGTEYMWNKQRHRYISLSVRQLKFMPTNIQFSAKVLQR